MGLELSLALKWKENNRAPLKVVVVVHLVLADQMTRTIETRTIIQGGIILGRALANLRDLGKLTKRWTPVMRDQWRKD